MPEESPFSTEEWAAFQAQTVDLKYQVVGDEDPFDRKKFEQKQAEALLDVWVNHRPDVRADMYSQWKILVDEGALETLNDFEIILMSYQTRDSKAHDAVKEGLTVMNDEWYQDNIMFENVQPSSFLRTGESEKVWYKHTATELSVDEIERVEALSTQARAIYEPNESRSTQEDIETFAARGMVATGAAVAAWAGALLAAPTVASAGAVAGTAAGQYGRPVVQWGMRQFASLQQANFEARIGTSMAANRVPGVEPVRDFFGTISARASIPVADIMINAATRVPRVGGALGTGAGVLARVGEVVTSGGRGKLLAYALSFYGGGVIRNAFWPEEVDENQAAGDPAAEEGVEGVEVSPEGVERTPTSVVFRRMGLDQLASDLETMTDEMDQAVGVAAVRNEEAAQAEAVLVRRQQVQEANLLGSDTAAAGEAVAGDFGPGEFEPSGLTAEEIEQAGLSIALGDGTFVEITGLGSIDEGISEAAFSSIEGARWLGEDENEEDLYEQGFFVYPDPTSLGEPNPRKIVLPLPPSGDPSSVILSYDNGRAWVSEQYYQQQQQEAETSFQNNLIGVPEGYRARESAPIFGFGDRFGGNTAPSPIPGRLDQDVDRYETDFIQQAQGIPDAFPGRPPVEARYRESDIWDQMATMSPSQIFRFQDMMIDAGAYTNDRVPTPGQFTYKEQQLIEETMWRANVNGTNFWAAADDAAEAGRNWKANNRPAGPAPRAPFAVPAHLRSIPGEKTVAEEVKARFAQKLGREATAEELGGIADELTGYHTTSNQEQIALYLAAYNGDNQGLLTGADMQRIEDPGAATSFDIADKWANEIDLNKRRETNSESFSRMLSATMGNRPSVGNLTAATGVAEIGRS